VWLGYAILVSEEIFNWMRRIEVGLLRDYGANPGIKQPPHITIKQPFETDHIEPFEEYLDKLAEVIEPFEITLKGVGSFDQGVIFLDVIQDPRLKALQQRILSDLASRRVRAAPFEDERYHFHATLATGLGNENFAKARKQLENVDAEFRFVFDTIALFMNIGPYEWIVERQRCVAHGPQESPLDLSPQ